LVPRAFSVLSEPAFNVAAYRIAQRTLLVLHHRRVLLAALAAGMLWFANGGGAQARPAAETALVDQRGSAFTLRELRGKPIVIAFVATRCTDACPIADAVFAQLARERAGAQLVTISLDPRYDTPFVMSRYARDLQAPAPAWRVASGKPLDVEAILDAFGVVRAGHDVHSTLVYCLDARGRLVRTLPLSTGTARDVRAWLAGR
jgi:cytochrome oxidase Cu insertion factor (SCO1/SenC/PrrC family)